MRKAMNESQQCSNQRLTFEYWRCWGLDLCHWFKQQQGNLFLISFPSETTFSFRLCLPHAVKFELLASNWEHYNHYHSCYFCNRIMFLHTYMNIICMVQVELCFVLLTINTHFMNDLLLCWFTPFRRMTPSWNKALGISHLIFTTYPKTQ